MIHNEIVGGNFVLMSLMISESFLLIYIFKFYYRMLECTSISGNILSLRLNIRRYGRLFKNINIFSRHVTVFFFNRIECKRKMQPLWISKDPWIAEEKGKLIERKGGDVGACPPGF